MRKALFIPSRINQSIDSLDDWYKDFNDSFGKILEKREQAVTEYINKLDDFFENILESMKSISKLLRDLLNNVTNFVSPFQDLMNVIQRQDIIRQNLENLIEVVEQVEDKYSDLQTFFGVDSDPTYN